MQLLISRFFIRKRDLDKEKATLFFRAASRLPKMDVLVSSQLQVDVKEWQEAVSCKASFRLHRIDNLDLHDKLSQIEYTIKQEMDNPAGFSKELVADKILMIINPNKARRILAQKAMDKKRRFEAEARQQEAKEKEIKAAEEKRNQTERDNQRIWNYLDQFCRDIADGSRLNNSQRYSEGTIKTWNSFKKLYERFDPKHKYYWDDIDRKFVASFVNFLETGGYMAKSLNKYVVTFRCLVGNAYKDAIHNNDRALQFFVKKKVEDHQKAVEIYLTEDELNALYEMPLEGKKAECRDVFLIGCYTCQRVSDYSEISSDSFVTTPAGYTAIRFIQRKTNSEVVVPILNPTLRKICEHYQYHLPIVGDVVLNRYIKEILKDLSETVPSLATKVTTQLTMKQRDKEKDGSQLYERNSKGEAIVPRWACVTTHTARRTGITHIYLSGKLNVIQMMNISGHKDQKTFFEYIKLSSQEIADNIAKAMTDA